MPERADAAVPSTALGLHEWILPHGTCPLCSPQCTKRSISLSSSARSGVFPVCISLPMGWILIFNLFSCTFGWERSWSIEIGPAGVLH